MTRQDPPALPQRVADAVELDSPEEASEVIRSVTAQMAAFFPSEAWEVLAPRLADELVGDAPSAPSPADRDIRNFFLGLGERMEEGTAVAARYARVVAEEIARDLDGSTLDRLRSVLDDDFLALFEVDHRGELTEEDGATGGVEQRRSPVELRPPLGGD